MRAEAGRGYARALAAATSTTSGALETPGAAGGRRLLPHEEIIRHPMGSDRSTVTTAASVAKRVGFMVSAL